MLKAVSVLAVFAVLGLSINFLVPEPQILSASGQYSNYPFLSVSNKYPVSAMTAQTPTTTSLPIVQYSNKSIDERFVGLLSHIKWLLNQEDSTNTQREINRINKQILSVMDGISEDRSDNNDSALPGGFIINDSGQVSSGSWQAGIIADAFVTDSLTIGTSSVLANNLITPNSILTTGQADELCLTYESTGSTFEWQTCGAGGGLTTNDFDTSVELAAILTNETGSGAVVFGTSPTFTTPNLGTPSFLALTNATGLPVGTGIAGLGAGVSTFLATPSSANLATAVTDETGTGALVFASSPTFSGIANFPAAGMAIGSTQPFFESAGILNLQNIGALDATTETTIEAAIDTLTNLTSASALATVGTITTGIWQGTVIGDAYLTKTGDWTGTLDGFEGSAFALDSDIGSTIQGYNANTSFLGNTIETSEITGATAVGANLLTLTNPSAVTFLRFNADNTVSALDAASFRTAIGAGAAGGSVSSVAATVPNGFLITGSPITASGTLAISFAAGYSLPLTASSTNWNTFYNTPSTRITAGNNIDWTGNTLDVVTTGDWTGTLDGFEGSAFALDSDIGSTIQGYNANTSFLGNTISANELTAADFGDFTCNGTSCALDTSYLTTANIDTSAELAGIVDDETGTGALVFAGSPTFTGTINAAAATLSSTLTLSGSAANIALGSNFLSGDGGDEGMFVNSTGNVGIGTTTTPERLTVQGNIRGDRFIGYGAGGITSNSAVGLGALAANTTGSTNTATGVDALRNNLGGQFNTANGGGALFSNTTGQFNTANGGGALFSNTTGQFNTANGIQSLLNLTTGTNNTADGTFSLFQVTTGANNSAFGSNTGFGITTGSNNTILGANVAGLAAALSNNIIIADGAGNQRINVGSTGNVGIGTTSPSTRLAVVGNILGDRFIGYGAGGITTNSAVGLNSLNANTTGDNNTGNGANALLVNTIGSRNTATGVSALRSNLSGNNNVAIGVEASLTNTTGFNSVATGYRALALNTDGSYNTANGALSLDSNTTGDHNTAIGFLSLATANTGNYNTTLGSQTLPNLSSGSNNTAIGYNTGVNLITGSNNTILGANVSGLAAALSNNIIIADGSGNRRINVDSTGRVGIGTTTPSQLLSVGATTGSQFLVSSTGVVSDGTWNADVITDAFLSDTLTIGAGSTFANNIVTPNSVLSTGQGDELCLTYETTGAAFEWQACGGGLASTDIDTSVELAGIIGDETGTGFSVFSNTPTFTGTIIADAATLSSTLALSGSSANIALGSNFLSGDGGDEGIFVDSVGKVGIGTVSPFSKLSVYDQSSDNTSLSAAEFGRLSSFSNTTSNFSTGVAGYVDMRVTGSNVNPGAGIAGNFTALRANSWTNDTGTLADLYGVRSVYGHGNTSGGTPITTNAYGLYVLPSKSSGTLTNMYDIFLADDTGAGTATNRWGIYQANTAKNYFGGNVGIGTTTPSTKFAVVGNILGDRFIGYGAGGITNNSAVGRESLFSNTTGFNNTATGYQSLFDNTTGDYNTATGYQSLTNNTDGNYNTATGDQALLNNTIGVNNTAVGAAALLTNTIGDFNTAIGLSSLYDLTTGDNNTAIGNLAGRGITTGSNNTILGANVTGLSSALSNWVIIADGAGNRRINVSNLGTVGIGFNIAATEMLQVNGNILGTRLLAYGPGGNNSNTAVGRNSLNDNTGTISNTAVGADALETVEGNGNTALGVFAGYYTAGNNNTAIGTESLNNSSGDENTAVGVSTIRNTSGSNNTAIGSVSGNNLTSGNNNSFFGSYTAAGITTGSNNTILGANVSGLAAALSNNIIIADGAGNQRINVGSTGNVGIGTTTPIRALTLFRSIDDTTALSIETPGTQSNQTVQIDLVSRSSGSFLGTANTKGWQLGVRGDTFSSAVERNDLGLFYFNGGSWTRSLTIDSLTGNIGIGATTTPGARFAVAGNSYLTGTLTVDGLINGKNLALNGGFLNEAETIGADWVNTANPWVDNEVSNTLTIGAGSTFGSNLITPNSILTSGQTDEFCLTYETTGATWEWQTCGAGGGLASTDIDTSAELRTILTDETGTGALVFAGSPTFTGTVSGGTFSGGTWQGSPISSTYLDSTLWRSGNDGAGSGLDADLLDGLSSGSFMSSGADDWVNTTGDTMSGNLTLSGTSANIVLGSNYLSGDGGDEGVFVSSTGNVGIGDTTPASLFTVGNGDLFKINSAGQVDSDPTNSSSVYAIDVLSSGTLASNKIARFGVTGTSNGFTVEQDGGSVMKYTFENGNVGIGTSVTTARLTVAGNISSSNPTYNFQSVTSGTVEGQFAANSGGAVELRAVSNHPVQFYTNNTLRMTVGNTGNIQLSAYGAGTLITDSSGNVTASSDERLKDIQRAFTSGLEAINGIEPIIYKWNATSSLETENEYLGFSAQNVKTFIPEAVGEDNRGFLTLSDRGILATVVNAVKELWDIVKGQGEQLEQLEQENEYLKERIETIENELNVTPPPTPAPDPVLPPAPPAGDAGGSAPPPVDPMPPANVPPSGDEGTPPSDPTVE